MNAAENSPRPGRMLFWLGNGIFVLLLVGLLILPRIYQAHQPVDLRPVTYGEALPARPAPDFALTNQDGKSFLLSSQHGKIVLMFFGFTHCPNICPTTLAKMAMIRRALTPEEQKRVQVIFISVDPDRDDAAALKGYVPFFDPSFIGLTGTPEQIAAVAKNYGVTYEKAVQNSQVADNNYTINHSVYTYLINPAGELTTLYDDEKLRDAPRVVEDLRLILKESTP